MVLLSLGHAILDVACLATREAGKLVRRCGKARNAERGAVAREHADVRSRRAAQVAEIERRRHAAVVAASTSAVVAASARVIDFEMGGGESKTEGTEKPEVRSV